MWNDENNIRKKEHENRVKYLGLKEQPARSTHACPGQSSNQLNCDIPTNRNKAHSCAKSHHMMKENILYFVIW